MDNIIEENIKTFSTYDYSVFKKMEGNRVIDLKNVNAIIKSINENGLLPIVIIVNEKMEVIDGQHRLEALKTLGLKATFQIHEGLKLKDCVALNVNGKKWALIDYIESYARLGNENYKKLLELISQFRDVSVSTIGSICIKRKGCGGGLTKIISSGRFEMPDIYEVSRKIAFIQKIEEYGLEFQGRKETFNTVIADILDSNLIDEERLLTQLEKYGYLIKTIVSSLDAIEKIEEIYNYRRSNKVYLVSEYRRRKNEIE